MRKTWLVLLPLFGAAACSTSDSDVIDTNGIYATFEALAQGDGKTVVSATLEIGRNSLNFLKLEGGDALRAVMINPTTLAENPLGMEQQSGLGMTWYETEFQTQSLNTGFRVEFTRGSSSKVNAISSNVTMPSPIDLLTSNGGTTFSRASTTPFYVQWDPYTFLTGDQLTYSITGSCIQTAQGTIAWPESQGGVDTLELTNNFLTALAGHETETCMTTLTLALTRLGSVDPAFEGGVFTATQERTLSLTCQP